MDVHLYRILRPVITVLVKVVFRPTIIGKENIPEESAFILAGNHKSNLDSVLLVASLKRTIHFLAKDSLNKGLKKILFKNMGIIPVNRKIHDHNALENAIDVLNDNKVIGVFPEAKRNLTENTILPFKTGAIRMARETDSYIVPFTIKGKYKPFRKSITIEFYKKRKVMSDNVEKENQKLMDFISKQLKKGDVR